MRDKANVTAAMVRQALVTGPATNKAIRTLMFGRGNEENDQAGCGTSSTLGAMKRAGLVTLGPKGEWRLVAEAPKPNTVRVRIAVAVDEKGNVYASGWRDSDSAPDEEAMAEHAIDNLLACDFDAHQTALVWVTADVPLPSVVVVEGEAK